MDGTQHTSRHLDGTQRTSKCGLAPPPGEEGERKATQHLAGGVPLATLVGLPPFLDDDEAV